ncbi:hypothetical protein [Lentilactobacillus parabuchneri]|uniref:hypothetical protein n=1 Tax=Lentilactobacillus parabuchneri TaxID=152331 RepID=UPI00384E32D0
MKNYKQLVAMISATFILVFALTGMTTQASTDYYTTNPKIIKTKRAVTYYRDPAKLHPDQKVSANHFAKITKDTAQRLLLQHRHVRWARACFKDQYRQIRDRKQTICRQDFRLPESETILSGSISSN